MPEADDPAYVHASPARSPDRKTIVFARARARSPLPDGPLPTYANDPREPRIQYDLYRLPFRNGKGGAPEPVPGASNNGMSTVDRVLDVLAWCADEGIHCIVNLMFGWPDETDEELDATIAFMDRAAPLAGGFNARGVVVPYPGTEIYERHHERFGFTGWWIREAPLAYPVFPTAWDEAEIVRAYADDPAIDRNFFRHPPHRIARIREALARKAELTMAITRRRAAASAAGPAAVPVAAAGAGVPAAGAR